MDDTVELPIPYFSQWESADLVPALLAGEVSAASDPAWARSGASTPQEYEFWSWRMCGIACLRMVLAHRDGSAPPAMLLKDDCVVEGAYVVEGTSVKGLIYAPFARYVERKWDLAAEVVTAVGLVEVGDLVRRAKPVMISVHPSVREPAGTAGGRGGHLVLAVGAAPDGLLLHNPSGLPGKSQEFAFVRHELLDRYYAGRGVVFEL
ncbi:C39 family peptidase [Actinosynnema sp. NPDC047251]|uniref:Peptidase C39-like domain-containing protein n=1 Tax=Saccharothrix espanaensis (strain ATCC 51144 / DSM 44229 / JCM 9112 / NBRC 15066 / NRRL 15764) TaxID=1179773 RepID=K0K7Y1_SACES|nr:C39 family peptidase [Saccharothrix espanaensis]CCH32969.1 hypothetical protein BN6_57110 [Saccharothrix espanaensis DSM 44229]